MMKTNMKKMPGKWKLVIIGILVLYGVVGFLLYHFQEKMIFHPEKLPADYVFHFDMPFQEFNIPLNDTDRLNAVLFKADNPRGMVIYFHGNSGNITMYTSYTSIFLQAGYDVLMPDYRGYGKSTGPLSEQAFYDDANVMYQLARGRFSADSILLYGKSLGTGIAAELAARHSCKALVLETPYDSFDLLAGRRFFIYPIKWLLKYHFPTHRFVADVPAPVLIFEGTEDSVTPYEQATLLKKALKPDDLFVTIQGGTHNDLFGFPVYHEKMNSLLNAQPSRNN